MNEAEQKATAQFVNAEKLPFGDKELEPFTARRQAAAQQMGMTWPNISPEDRTSFHMPIPPEELKKIPKRQRPKSGVMEIPSYRQAFEDSVIALWLCSQPLSRVARAARKVDEALDEMWTWAEAEGISVGNEKAGEAFALWCVITQALMNAKGKPVSKKTGEPTGEQDTGEL